MKRVFGVMGSACATDAEVVLRARALGAAVAARGGVLLTGATGGYPLEAARGAAEAGGWVLGISPAQDRAGHEALGMPLEPHDVIVYTGFGYKGRNVINIRGCDAVLFVAGSVGTLNEFTIAYDEGKVMGVLSGSGGLSDRFPEIVMACAKPTAARIVHDRDPKSLVEAVAALLG